MPSGELKGVIVDGVEYYFDFDFLVDKPEVIPTHGSVNIGDVLTVDSNGNYLEWTEPATGVPDATSSDEGKVLTVTDNGNGDYLPTWEEPSGGLPSYSSSDNGKVLTVMSSGNNDASAEWATPTRLLPVSTGEDDGKVLMVASNGTPTWSNLPSGDEFPDYSSAAGKVLVCSDNSGVFEWVEIADIPIPTSGSGNWVLARSQAHGVRWISLDNTNIQVTAWS